MALTVAQVGRSTVFGNKKVTVADITFDSSYPTGGEDLNPSALGLSFVDVLIADGAMGYSLQYDYANSKLKAFGSTAGTEVTNATNLSTLVCRVIAIGA